MLLFVYITLANVLAYIPNVCCADKQGHKECETVTTILNDTDCCYVKSTENLLLAFSSIRLTFNCSDCEILTGPSLEDVYSTEEPWYNVIMRLPTLLSPSYNNKNKKITLHLSPYVDTYIRAKHSSKPVEVERELLVFDATSIAYFVSGLILFFAAPQLSQSITFYYTGGVGIGMLASLLVIVFLLSRLAPKKPVAYTIMFGGWSICAWILRKLWENWKLLFSSYRKYFFAYIGVSGFVSFVLCYWLGPIKDPRSQSILQWTIQLIAIILLYNSAQITEVSVIIILTTVFGSTLYSSSNQVLSGKFWWKYFHWRKSLPPKRFLTEEEYREQGKVETERALKYLREFCDSPKCSPWKTISRMQTPTRFAKFVEGSNHISDQELLDYDDDTIETEPESILEDGDVTEDEGDITEDDRNSITEEEKSLDASDGWLKKHFSEDEG